jgi:hypothetical protein
MAKMTITIEDAADGALLIDCKTDDPIPTSDAELTDAQKLAAMVAMLIDRATSKE